MISNVNSLMILSLQFIPWGIHENDRWTQIDFTEIQFYFQTTAQGKIETLNSLFISYSPFRFMFVCI